MIGGRCLLNFRHGVYERITIRHNISRILSLSFHRGVVLEETIDPHRHSVERNSAKVMRYVVERLEKERRRREAGNTLRRLNNSGAPPPSGAGWRVGFPISTVHYKAGLAPCAPLPKPYPIKPHSQSSSSDVWMTLFST
jgi:hypothetical protein